MVAHRHGEWQAQLGGENLQAVAGQLEQASSGELGRSCFRGRHHAQEASSDQARPSDARPADVATEHDGQVVRGEEEMPADQVEDGAIKRAQYLAGVAQIPGNGCAVVSTGAARWCRSSEVCAVARMSCPGSGGGSGAWIHAASAGSC